MSDYTDRVAALLAKAEATDNDAEAEAYLAKAYALMAKYNIEEAMLSRHNKDAAPTENPVWFAGTYARERMEGAYGIALAAFPDVLVCFATPGNHYDYKGVSTTENDKRKGKYLYVLGYPSDVESFMALWTSVDLQAASSLRRWWKQSKYDLDTYGRRDPEWFRQWLWRDDNQSLDAAKSQARRSYLHGYFFGVRTKLESIHQAAVASVPGAELALSSRAKDVQELADTWDLKNTRKRSREYSAAINDGFNDGRIASVTQHEAAAGQAAGQLH